MPRFEKLASALHTTKNITEHVKLIERQVKKSMTDPETRQLAVKLVSGAFDWKRDPRSGQDVPVVDAWGHYYRAPDSGVCAPRDEACEIKVVWDFVVLNIRYVYDPPDTDTFATLKATLDAGGGDCDDMTIAFAALLKSIGFSVAARVISTKDNPEEWVHVYPMIGMPKDNPKEWVPLDATVKGVTPGWQYPDIAAAKDFML